MKPARSYPQVIKRWYRPVERECQVCHRTLREALTLTKRTVITLQAVIKLTHAGYRCPEKQCSGHLRTYRSTEADALALPHMTYGLDIVLLVGRLRLREHRTVDEVHQELLRRLDPLGVRIARREILYLFEAYCTLLKASSEAKEDQAWLHDSLGLARQKRLSARFPALLAPTIRIIRYCRMIPIYRYHPTVPNNGVFLLVLNAPSVVPGKYPLWITGLIGGPCQGSNNACSDE